MTTSISAAILMRYDCVGLCFSLFLLSWKPCMRVSQLTWFPTLEMSLSVGMFMLHPETQHQVQDQLLSHYFHLPLQSHPDHQANSDTLCQHMV